MFKQALRLCLLAGVIFGMVNFGAGFGDATPMPTLTTDMSVEAPRSDTDSPVVGLLDESIAKNVTDEPDEPVQKPILMACDPIQCTSSCRAKHFCEGECVSGSCRCYFYRTDFAYCP